MSSNIKIGWGKVIKAYIVCYHRSILKGNECLQHPFLTI